MEPISNQMEILWCFNQTHAQYWFFRFSTNWTHRILACGNALGDVCLWDMAENKKEPTLVLEGKQMNRNQAVRWIAFSPSNRFMVAPSDDGSLWIWEILYNREQK